jgi:hypothetical protein
MKTKLLLLILLIVGSVGTGNAYGESAAKIKPPVRVVIKFFKSRTGCVEPRGLCASLEYTGYRTSDPTYTLCNGTYEFNLLTIAVPKSTINESGRKSLVGYSSLPIDADFTFPIETSRTLGSLAPITIKAGDYPIRETIDEYIITFPCK